MILSPPGLAYSSGSAALLNICHLLKTGDTVISVDDVYGGTNRYFQKVASENNLKVIFVDCTKPKCLEAAITPETKLVWLETPTNPTLKVVDIKACADVAHNYGDMLVSGKRTGLSPVPVGLEMPVGKGSIDKELQFWSLHWHCDVLMGLVSVNSHDLYERLKHLQSRLGAVPSPFDCYMCNRGLKTLHIRMKLHFQNGLAVAKFLESHPRVEKVIYPGLPSHPQHEVMKRQCTGVSGLISFYIRGTKDNAFAFLENLKVRRVQLSPGAAAGKGLPAGLGSWGSSAGPVQSALRRERHSATMTHSSISEEIKEKLGITDTLIRLSVGLEDEEDLLADLDQALKAAFP
ncbi:hypothetical protein DV515_00017219 [Chloebia gouldiae]|uniref:Cystathionine gamma-lyase n=1 Tax=Chloebia gouldiae TaxID=44316 RepID=A0A3L8R0V2_CHLGU|nr:hypothetical protein DV515_00017219 [Chloebia gouldiae]